MGEKVRAAGVRAVAQKLASTLEEVESFVTQLAPNPFKIIVRLLVGAVWLQQRPRLLVTRLFLFCFLRLHFAICML